MTLPLIWSVAGTDSGGGAGLAADQRAAEACGVHLCPVVAAVTAQNSVAVTQVQAVDPALLDAQLAALAEDLPPTVIKTGLLGSADNARVLARWIDRLRERGPVALVIDPVLSASTGAGLADEALLAAYRDALLPRATVITPNQAEATRLLARPGLSVPEQAAALQALGPRTVCITGGDAGDAALALDWLHSPQAQGWLSLPRLANAHTHGTGCTFASSLASALARGFVDADAAVLAKMATAMALRHAQALGQGAGPVRAQAGFIAEPAVLPHLSPDPAPPSAWPTARSWEAPGLYAIVDSAARVQAVLAAGVKTVQLRIKAAHLSAAQRDDIAQAIVTTRAAGALLYVNDHWALALDLGAQALHLGQEDLLALTPTQRAQLRHAQQQHGVRLGISSHSLWELCRARSWCPSYIACGPVWPTTTKDMPWRPQGLDNLAWWAHMAGAPVVAIGGILAPDQLTQAAASGALGGCVVRGLGDDPATTLPAWQAAWAVGMAQAETASTGGTAAWPHPSLTRD